MFTNNKIVKYSIERDTEIKNEFWVFTSEDRLNAFKQIRLTWLLNYLKQKSLL
mgnify:CR=1